MTTLAVLHFDCTVAAHGTLGASENLHDDRISVWYQRDAPSRAHLIRGVFLEYGVYTGTLELWGWHENTPTPAFATSS